MTGVIINTSKLVDEIRRTGTTMERFSQLAVARTADLLRERWQEQVARSKLWQGEKQPYLNSIGWQMTGPFSAVVASDYPKAREIEDGRPARDLKYMLQTSAKVRLSKAGKRYLIIPFRHNTPGNSAHAAPMPEAVYAMAKYLSPSAITGQGQRTNANGYLVPQAQYRWGDRIQDWHGQGITAQQRSRMAGMVRMKNAAGGSQYLTFRNMVEGSPGWITKPQPGLNLLPTVTDSVQRDVPALLYGLLQEIRAES